MSSLETSLVQRPRPLGLGVNSRGFGLGLSLSPDNLVAIFLSGLEGWSFLLNITAGLYVPGVFTQFYFIGNVTAKKENAIK